jgi:UDP-glucose 4-epimerase
MRIAVTGSTGFVGRRYMQVPLANYAKEALDLRRSSIDDLDLAETDVIVHLAGKAHDMQGGAEEQYFSVNFELTRNLADRARESGVRQFIYVSSTKVYGDEVRTVLNEQSDCRPTDPYGESKFLAENYLISIDSEDFKVAIVRPPLVYGPHVKGNMIRLLNLASKKFPLPLANTGNARSMVFVDNLVALIDKIVVEKAKGVLIAGDIKPLSTQELVTAIRNELGNRAGMFTIPGFIRPLIRKIRPALYLRLFGSFVVDNSGTNRKLNFVPPFSSNDGIRVMTKWYKARENNAHAEII